MPPDFDNKAHGLRKLRVTVRRGWVWASFSAGVPDFATDCGPEVIRMHDRMYEHTYNGRALRLLGHTRQSVPCNWKKHFENHRDPYHGTLLHMFFVVFGLYRADNYQVLTPEEGRPPQRAVLAAEVRDLGRRCRGAAAVSRRPVGQRRRRQRGPGVPDRAPAALGLAVGREWSYPLARPDLVEPLRRSTGRTPG